MKKLFKKINIVEVIKIEDDLELLQHHLANVYENLSNIILAVPKNYEKLVRLENLTSKWVDKISFFHLEENQNFLSEKTITTISKLLYELEIGFEDVVCFSKINEVPNFNVFETVLENLKFHPVILRMRDFVYNTQIYSPQCHMGSICFNFSFLTNKPKLAEQLNNIKDTIVGNNFNVFDNGWNFSYFTSLENIIHHFKSKKIEINFEDLENCFSKNYHPIFFENNKLFYLSDFEGDINFDVLYLNEYFHDRNIEVNNLVVLNFNQMRIPTSFCSEYDRVFNFNFGRNYSLPEVSETGNLKTLNIFLPNHDLYTTNNDDTFEFVYNTNEIKRILSKSNLRKNHTLEIVVLPNYLEHPKKKTISWAEFKNTSPNEVFRGIF